MSNSDLAGEHLDWLYRLLVMHGHGHLPALLQRTVRQAVEELLDDACSEYANSLEEAGGGCA